jgi:hypothetical protein
VSALLHAITREKYALPPEIRPALFETAAQGDPVAVEVVSTFGRELGLLATNLIRKYSLGQTAPYVVASGSLFVRGGSLLFDVFREYVRLEDASAKVVRNDRPPVAGAVRAALLACGASISNWQTTSSSYEGALNAD